MQGGRFPAIRTGGRRDPGPADLPGTHGSPAALRRRHDRGLLPRLVGAPMPATTRPGPRTPVWTDLRAHATRLAAVPVQELFERDPGRFERSEEHTSELQSRSDLVCRLLLEKKKKQV